MFVTLKSFITFFIHATVSTSTINGMSDYAVAQQIRCGVHITYCVTLQDLKKKYSLRHSLLLHYKHSYLFLQYTYKTHNMDIDICYIFLLVMFSVR